MQTDPYILQKLQAAWNVPVAIVSVTGRRAADCFGVDVAGEPLRHKPSDADRAPTPVMEAIPAIRLGGVAIERCLTHYPPYDLVDVPDSSRPGWIRSTCRKCGTFMGYRPENMKNGRLKRSKASDCNAKSRNNSPTALGLFPDELQ